MRLPGAIFLLVMVALLLTTAPAVAQTPFAMQALGQNVEMTSARDVGRGGWGMADTDTLAPGSLNQAALADLEFTGLIFSGYGESTRNHGDGLQRHTYRTVVPNIRLALPLVSARFALHVGFVSKRSMEWTSLTQLEYEVFGDVVTGTERNQRTGTLYHVPVGVSWRLFPGLAVAGSYNVVRGVIRDEITQLLPTLNRPYYLPNITEQTDDLSGTCYTASLLVDALPFVQLGASYTSAYDLEMKRTVTMSGVSDRYRTQFTGAMPADIRAGLMFRLPNNWRVGVDGQIAAYSQFSGREDWDPIMEDEWTLSAGVERTWVRTEFGRSYDVPIRVGYQMRQWAHTVGGLPVTERTISAGTGFPFSNRMGMIDISLSYSIIGDEAENGYRSNVWRLGLSLIGLEPLVF